MTLTEYLNQPEPQKMPNVVLKEGEYKIHQTIKAGQDTLTLIEIPAIWERFGATGNYIQKNGGATLYTQDADGNAKSPSCFKIATGEELLTLNIYKDGELLKTFKGQKTDTPALGEMHRQTGCSSSHAIKYEGYKVEVIGEETGEKYFWK